MRAGQGQPLVGVVVPSCVLLQVTAPGGIGGGRQCAGPLHSGVCGLWEVIM